MAHRVDENARGVPVWGLHFQYIGRTLGCLCGPDPSEGRLAREQQGHEKPADLALEVAALEIAQAL
jgi:hypothetical protein